ncbi:Uncharacterized protein TCM_024235 [Theobroma cacao]|uniref:Uncharacterized protein n=1 Tax=Theobroma cacao TaxID=3641 RepID=A0A061EVU6_THECC|nr:Uncharacterized protein TCM_024235 [Theobroma cacao]
MRVYREEIKCAESIFSFLLISFCILSLKNQFFVSKVSVLHKSLNFCLSRTNFFFSQNRFFTIDPYLRTNFFFSRIDSSCVVDFAYASLYIEQHRGSDFSILTTSLLMEYFHFDKNFNHLFIRTWQNGNFKKLEEESMISLERPFIKEKVWETIQTCHGNKALGLEGYNLNFFKSQWQVVKEQVMKFMNEFYNIEKLGKRLNSSFVFLIPKISNQTIVNEFKHQLVKDVVQDCGQATCKLFNTCNQGGYSLMGIGVDMSVVGRWMKGKDNFMQNGIITLCLPRATIRSIPNIPYVPFSNTSQCRKRILKGSKGEKAYSKSASKRWILLGEEL